MRGGSVVVLLVLVNGRVEICLGAVLDLGPAADAASDRRWTLARVAALIARSFSVSYTLRGVSYLLHRMGSSPLVPVHRPPSAMRRGSPSGGL